jgi:hypothetical protein
MSGYISSLLVESVFRQARRFSGLSETSDAIASERGNPKFNATDGTLPALPIDDGYSSDSRSSIDEERLRLRRVARNGWRRESVSDRDQSLAAAPLLNEEILRINEASSTNNSNELGLPASVLFHSTVREDTVSDVCISPNLATETRESPAAERRETSSSSQSNVESSIFRLATMSARRIAAEDDLHALTEDFDWDDKGQSILPADDGMSRLRGKIHRIRDTKASNSEKARLIHALMTESYHASFRRQARSPANLLSTPTSPQTGQSVHEFPPTPASTTSIPSFGNRYNLTAHDLEPTYIPRTERFSLALRINPALPVGEADETIDEGEGLLGCQHYERNVKLQCYTCKRWYTCRFCHDEAEEHSINRRETENMLCMLCNSPQPAAQWCKICGIQAACYYCSVCKLWDNDNEKSIYHCHDCGICRIGQGLGKDFFHCKVRSFTTREPRYTDSRQTCCVCMPISIETTHRCIERSTQCDCPICGDYMFTSPETVIFMRCGHSIHQRCFSEYSKTSYRCPICSKSIANMETHFRNLDRTIETQPMPPEFKDTQALIYCNDCCAKSAVQYHWLGLKCDMFV